MYENYVKLGKIFNFLDSSTNSFLAFESKLLLRHNLGASVAAPDAPSHTSMLIYFLSLSVLMFSRVMSLLLAFPCLIRKQRMGWLLTRSMARGYALKAPDQEVGEARAQQAPSSLLVSCALMYFTNFRMLSKCPLFTGLT